MPFSLLDTLESETGLIDVKRVAELFQISKKTVYARAKMKGKKKLPGATKVGHMRFDPSVLAYYVRSQDREFAAAKKDAERQGA